MTTSSVRRVSCAAAIAAAAVIGGGTATHAGRSAPGPIDDAGGDVTIDDVIIDDDGYAVFGGSPVPSMPSPEQYVVAVTDADVLAEVATELAGSGIEINDSWNGALNGFSARLDPDLRARLRERPGVLTVERDDRIELEGIQDGAPWNLDRVDQRSPALDSLYMPRESGVGVTAYVIDSGIRTSHTEFTGRIGHGAYFDFGDNTGIEDCDGHGTHVAGIIGGTTWGVAKSVSIVPVKALSCAGITDDSILIGAINWVINDHGPDQPAVVNLSIGGRASSSVDAAVRAMIDDGITVVVAAGNDAMPTCSASPARVTEAITVAASTPADDDASFSNYGACNDLFAPGVGITSASYLSDGGSQVMSGTSMAAPHVAGAAALVLETNPSASPAQVWAMIDAATTRGAISECCGDPDKLLYVEPLTVDTLPPPIPPPAPDAASPDLVPVVPARLFDSRPGGATIDGQFEGVGRRPAGSIIAVNVVGRGGIAAGAMAVMLNVTAVSPNASGYLTVYPCGEVRPIASNVNFIAGEVVANAVFAEVGVGGRVCVYSLAATDLVIDVDGFVPAGGATTPVVPARLLDSRAGAATVDGQFAGGGRRPAGSVTEVDVVGRGGIAENAMAVMLNVTAVSPDESGYLTVYPCGEARPTASNVNYTAGQIVANAVFAKVGAGGRVCVYSPAATDLVIDADGYVPAGGATNPVVPARLLDSRGGAATIDGQFQDVGRRPAGSVTEVDVVGRGGVSGSAVAVMLNVTAVSPDEAGYLTVYPCGQARPVASNVNFTAGQIVANAVFAKVGAGGRICVYSPAATDLVIDANGYVPD